MTVKAITYNPDKYRIELEFPYSNGLKEKVKAIPDARFDGDEKIWYLPPTKMHALFVASFAREYGFFIDAVTLKLSRNNHKVTKTSRTKLYPYQVEGLEFLHASGGRALLADHPGLGKTIQTLAYMEETAPAKVLIVSPASVTYMWKEKIKEWLGWDSEVIQGFTKDFNNKPRVLICSYPVFTSRVYMLRGFSLDLVIFDEIHYLKDMRSQRSRASRLLNAPNVIGLSGTPFLNRPKELFPILNLLLPTVWSSFWKFAHRYCNPPEAPIWMGDYSFKPLGEIKKGDEVIGWKKRTKQRKSKSKGVFFTDTLCRAKVLEVYRKEAEIVRVTFKSGNSIRCTPDHLWLASNNNRSEHEYLSAKVGRKLSHVITPSYAHAEGRWLAGMYDGEGCGAAIAQSVSHNPEVCNKIKQDLNSLGIEFNFKDDKYLILNGRQGIVDFLNKTNPIRRTSRRLDSTILTGKIRVPDEVVSIKPDGFGEVISMTTETGNYVAWGYASKNCDAKQDHFGHWDFDGADNLPELKEKLSHIMLRRTKQEVLKDLPPVTKNYFPYISETKKLITQYFDALKLAIEDTKSKSNSQRFMAVRQAIGMLKVEPGVELAEEVLNGGEKVVLFAIHKSVVAELEKKLKDYKMIKIVGDTPQKDRNDLVSTFLNDPDVRVAIISEAGGEGINLYSASTLIFVERSWSPGKEEQVYSRIHRIGQVNPVTVHYIIAKGTIDDRIHQIIQKKQEVLGQVINFDDIPVNDLLELG